MKNKNISEQVDNIFEVLNSIEKTSVSPFFKQKVLHKMFLKEEEKTVMKLWFTPKLQLAAIALVLLVNAISLFYVFNENNSTTIDNFAKEYSLSSTNTYLN
jgi:hypothetical protein